MSRQEKERLYHFESVCLDVEVRVVPVALDHTGLDSSSPTLNEDLRAIHGEQLYLLHFSDSPEEDLMRRPAELSLRDPGRSQHAGPGVGAGSQVCCLETKVCSSGTGRCSSLRAPSYQLCLISTPQAP